MPKNEYNILRKVRVPLCGKNFILETWNTGRRHKHGQSLLGYSFYEEGQENNPIFTGEDFGTPGCIDADDTLSSILGFLSLREGETDSEYFEGYTETQWEFSRNYGEELGLIVLDMEENDLSLEEIDFSS